MDQALRTKTTELRQAVAEHLKRRVSVTVGASSRGSPLVCLSGPLEGLVNVPSGDEAPLSLVVAGQDIMIWPSELDEAAIVSGADGHGFAVEFTSGSSIRVDRVD